MSASINPTAFLCSVLLFLILSYSIYQTNSYFRYTQGLPFQSPCGQTVSAALTKPSSSGTTTTTSASSADLGDQSVTDNDSVIQPKQLEKKNSPKFQSFNTTNPYKDGWCQYATCQNSPMCSPCNRRFLFILATARSASTTLLKMLNYLPNVRMSGENLNLLFVASKMVSNFKGEKVAHLLDQNFDRIEGAYLHNAIPPQAMSCPIQQVINTLNPPPKNVQIAVNLTNHPSMEEYDRNRILGAKTIRFHKGDWSIGEASDFLREIFPCSRIVVNIRSDIESQLKSLNTTFSSAHNYIKGTEFIKNMNDFLVGVAKDLGPDMAKLVDMTEWTKDVEILNDVILWLGYRDCRFSAIVHENTNGFGRDHETLPDLGANCHYAG